MLTVVARQAQVAESYGLIVKADDIKTGFRQAFKETSAQYPLYGKHSSPPLHYEDWWSLVIERTFEHADVASSGAWVDLVRGNPLISAVQICK